MVRANGGVATAEMLAPYLEPERDFDAADADAAAVTNLAIIYYIYYIYIITRTWSRSGTLTPAMPTPPRWRTWQLYI